MLFYAITEKYAPNIVIVGYPYIDRVFDGIGAAFLYVWK